MREYYIAVFRSRTTSLAFSQLLTKRGISNSVVPTPLKAKVGCGICVRVGSESSQRMLRLLKQTMQFNSGAVYKVLNNDVLRMN